MPTLIHRVPARALLLIVGATTVAFGMWLWADTTYWSCTTSQGGLGSPVYETCTGALRHPHRLLGAVITAIGAAVVIANLVRARIRHRGAPV